MRLYRRPEDSEEMNEGVRIIKDIPEAMNTPKVLVKLGTPAVADKFVYMKDSADREYVIALPFDDKGYHRDIVNFARKLYGQDFNVDGGGFLQMRDGKLIVSGQSEAYGEAPKRVVSILKEALPDLEVVDESPKEGANVALKKALEKIPDSFKKELYSAVVGDLGVRMGFDMTMLPKEIDGLPDAAYMIYRSENGSSFGVDTLFTGIRKSDNTISVHPAAMTRWNMEDVSVRGEADQIVISFTTNGETHELQISIQELDKKEPYSDLNDGEKAILDMYKANQFVYKDNPNPIKTWHGAIG